MAQVTRFRSLDALRGLAILGMAWSGMLPDSLPAWMYHGQDPPPDHVSNTAIFGITWVDLIFPFFLFSMGAAIPIAISNRLAKGATQWQLLTWLAGRGLLLAGLAIFLQHLEPYQWSADPGLGGWGISIFAFGLLVLMFGSFPKGAPPKVMTGLKWGAWATAFFLICFHVYPSDGNRGFENFRNDIILMVLANVAFSGGVLWILTRCRPLIRIVLMIGIIFVFLGQSQPDSAAKQIWDFTPLQFFTFHHWTSSRFFPILYHFEYHKYLLIVLPGTICGDLILKASQEDEGRDAAWGKPLLLGIFGLALATCVVACVGLFSRATILTFWLEAAICAGLIAITTKPGVPAEQLVARMVRNGTAILLLGLLAEPLGGGIRKDNTTLSYFIVTAGLAFFALAALEIAIDLLHEKVILKFAWLTGMNPLLGYIAITNLVAAISGITGYSDRLSAGALVAHPWLLAIFDGGMRTLLVGLVASAGTRWKIFLKT